MTGSLLRRTVEGVSSIGVGPADDEETRLKKAILLTTTLAMSGAGIIWGLLYVLAGEYVAGLIPISYAVLSLGNLILLSATHRYRFFRTSQILMTLLLPFLLMWELGGFVSGSAVILWGFLAPLGALLCWRPKQATLWFVGFVALVAASGFLAPLMPRRNGMSEELIMLLYVVNIAAVCGVAFGVLVYFVKQKNLAMQLLQKNRELERANMEQELLLRQSEKLATLGRLSAGVAHELNNPAAAARRGAAQLGEALSTLELAHAELGRLEISESSRAVLAGLHEHARDSAGRPTALDALTRSDREAELESGLAAMGLDGAWECAPDLVDMGYDTDSLAELSAGFSPAQVPTVIASMSSTYATQTMLQEIGQGTTRISEIVRALKTYTHLDQAPVQFLDVNEGLDNTLVMLRSSLKGGVDVRRDYAPDLPCVHGRGSELNQVWTNILDNSLDAMDGQGRLDLRTYCEGESVVVEITDDGPGIPEDVLNSVFDPFFTTKSLGNGSGLGLNISRNIVTQHNGEISVRSKPGETTFIVKLPLEMEEPSLAAPLGDPSSLAEAPGLV